MKGSVQPYLKFRQLPTGRRIFALQQMLVEARKLEWASLVTFLEDAIRQARQTLELELRWYVTRDDRSVKRGDAVVLDVQIDGQFGAMESIAKAQAVGDTSDPDVKAAQDFVQAVFPLGLTAITQQDFEAQLQHMDLLVERFQGDLRGAVEQLGLQKQVGRLVPLVEQFRAELAKAKEPLTFNQVRAAQQEGLERFAAAVVQVLGTYWDRDETSTARREALLAEANRQDELVAESLRRRRPVLDVDPDSGNEVDEPQPAPVAPAA